MKKRISLTKRYNPEGMIIDIIEQLKCFLVKYGNDCELDSDYIYDQKEYYVKY